MCCFISCIAFYVSHCWFFVVVSRALRQNGKKKLLRISRENLFQNSSRDIRYYQIEFESFDLLQDSDTIYVYNKKYFFLYEMKKKTLGSWDYSSLGYLNFYLIRAQTNNSAVDTFVCRKWTFEFFYDVISVIFLWIGWVYFVDCVEFISCEKCHVVEVEKWEAKIVFCQNSSDIIENLSFVNLDLCSSANWMSQIFDWIKLAANVFLFY